MLRLAPSKNKSPWLPLCIENVKVFGIAPPSLSILKTFSRWGGRGGGLRTRILFQPGMHAMPRPCPGKNGCPRPKNFQDCPARPGFSSLPPPPHPPFFSSTPPAPPEAKKPNHIVLVFAFSSDTPYCIDKSHSQMFGRENLFRPKKHLKTAISRGQISASPHFGKIWRPNC